MSVLDLKRLIEKDLNIFEIRVHLKWIIKALNNHTAVILFIPSTRKWEELNSYPTKASVSTNCYRHNHNNDDFKNDSTI